MNRAPEAESAPPPVGRTDPPSDSRLASLGPEARIGAVVALAVVAGLVVWLFVRGSDNSSGGKGAAAHAVSVRDLATLAAQVQHPVYWAGPKSGFTYELTQTSDGRIYVRYLPAGVPVGTNKPDYLTIGTYPLKNAVGAVRAIAKREKTTTLPLSGGGLAVQDVSHPTSVYFAYPGSDYQVEVFDPSAARARRVVLSGQVSNLESATLPRQATPSAPKLATVRQLRALESSAGHAVYWVGPESGVTYELTKTSDGRIYIRYLPSGTELGDRRPHTTVGTYPLQNPMAAIRAIGKTTDRTTFPIASGGLAVVNGAHPTSVYVAFPGSGYQIEVFDPSPARARQFVTSGLVAPVR